MLGVECGVPILVEMFEEVTVINFRAFLGRFYIITRSKYKLITGFQSKVYDWDQYYLFVKINEASVANVNEKFITEWSSAIGSFFSLLYCLIFDEVEILTLFFFLFQIVPFPVEASLHRPFLTTLPNFG